MGKKRGKSRAKEAPASTTAPPLNNPFAALEGLRNELPVGELPPEEAAPTPRPGADEQIPMRVILRRERKGRGGKTVTRVEGLANDADSATRWLKKLKAELGCGGSLEGADLILHGDIGDRVAMLLERAGVKRVVRGS